METAWRLCKMASVLQKVLSFAHHTLSKTPHKDIHKHVSSLKELVKNLKCEDVAFDKRILQDNTKFTYSPRSHDAPVTYVHVCENEAFSAGVFIVRNGARLPLHDHPNMSGLLKMIHGQAAVQCYTETNEEVPDFVKQEVPVWKQENIKRVVASPEHVIDTNSEPCVLTPSDSNIHEIRATGGVAAFFDILFPPYDQISGSRLCRYYKLVWPSTVQERSKNLEEQYLIEIPQPRDFWCNSLPFEGLSILPSEGPSICDNL